jgi:adenylylsulfate kinase
MINGGLESKARVMETRGRALAKALSYRLVSSLLTGTLFFGATQRARLALTLMLLDSVVKILVFYLHERAWTKISVRQCRVAVVTVQTLEPELELT